MQGIVVFITSDIGDLRIIDVYKSSSKRFHGSKFSIKDSY
jgi:hypothetical protein